MLTKVNVVNEVNALGQLFVYKKIARLNEHVLSVVQVENRTLDFHVHDLSDELFYVIEGSFELETKEGLTKVNQGEFIIVPRNTPHRPVVGKLTKFCKTHFGKGVAKRVPVYLATMVTWFATGIWHGASWNFVMWGIMNGVIILISQELEPLYARFHKQFPSLGQRKGYQAFQIVRTFFLMGSLRMFDCYGDVPLSFSMFFSMFRDFDLRALTVDEFLDLGLNIPQYVIVFAGTVLMFSASVIGRKESVREQLSRKPYVVRYAAVAALFLAVVLFGSYGVGYDAAQFIYNQF